MLRISGVTKNNLHDVSVDFPLGRLIAISGVSGSGKSTLIHDTLVPAISSWLTDSKLSGEHWRSLQGAESLQRLLEIDQSPIGRSPRSTPATYCGLWDGVRKAFASTRDAKTRGYPPNRFSFNSGEGRCDTCAGAGRVKLEMSFLEQVDVPCAACNAKRFNRSTLAVKYKDKSIADVLDMTIDQASEFFANFSDLQNALECMRAVGLGYLTLGQRSTTLSGGEAQRIKLATELQKRSGGSTVYVLDEPTTGLHLADIERVVNLLLGLVEKGNTVIVVEHQLDLISCCDWVIDMGPEGGSKGGQVVGVGTPEQIAKLSTPTGKAFEKFLASKSKTAH
jgi:excinuclease ABC subunit A